MIAQPHQTIALNDDQSLGANFCYREVKRVSQQLILSLEVEVRTSDFVRWYPEKNDPREDEREVVSCCSIARSFLSSEIEEKKPIPSTVIFFVETGVV